MMEEGVLNVAASETVLEIEEAPKLEDTNEIIFLDSMRAALTLVCHFPCEAHGTILECVARTRLVKKMVETMQATAATATLDVTATLRAWGKLMKEEESIAVSKDRYQSTSPWWHIVRFVDKTTQLVPRHFMGQLISMLCVSADVASITMKDIIKTPSNYPPQAEDLADNFQRGMTACDLAEKWRHAKRKPRSLTSRRRLVIFSS